MELIAVRGLFRDVSFVTLGVEPGFSHEEKINVTIDDEIVDLSGLLSA